MRVLLFIFALMTVAYTGKLKNRNWKSNKVVPDQKYDYDSKTMTPIRFKTVTNPDPSLPETWLTFYFGQWYWGQLRFSETTWGVELYACTDNKLYDNNNTLTGVPDGPKRIWEVYWDNDHFYLDCNGNNVWTYSFNDAIFPDNDCRGLYTRTLTQFEFNGDREGINPPEAFYTRRIKKWKGNNVVPDKKYDYDNKTMTPIRFKTVTNPDPSLSETWLTFYFGQWYWGQLRFSETTWGVELYACTDNKLYDNNNTLTGVPDGPKRIWEVYWDNDHFYLDCNGNNVWTYSFNDAIFPDHDCRGLYTRTLTQFEFNGDRQGINPPKTFYTRKIWGQ